MSKQQTRGIGDNSGEISSEKLRSFVKRIEKLETDKAAVCEDIRDVFAEVKSSGFAPAIVRQCVKKRRMDADKRREQEELLELYWAALGTG